MEKKDVHKLVLWYVLVASAVVIAIPASSAISRWGNSLAPTRTLTVSAQGKTTATPDLAEVSFSVVSQGKSPDALSADNNQKMSVVIDFVKSLGIASSDIATTEYDLSPYYATSPSATNPNAILGYTLTQTVEVKIRDFTNIAKLLGGLTPLGINQIGGVSFTFDNPDKFLAIARGDAMSRAKKKAAEMAGEAGVSLGEIVNVQEYGNIPVYPVYAARAASGVSMEAVAPSIQPGTQDVTDQVSIVYEVK